MVKGYFLFFPFQEWCIHLGALCPSSNLGTPCGGIQAPSILWIPSPLGVSKFSPFNLQVEKEIEGSCVGGSHVPGLEVAYIISVLIPSITTQYMTPHNGKVG